MRMIFLRFLSLPSRRGLLPAFALAMTFLVTSCAALDKMLATPTPLPPTATATPTPTIVWFPPSITPTPQALLTRQPTPEMRPDVGEVILRDNFSAAAPWNVAASDQGSAALAQNRLNLAAQSQIYMASLRRETNLADFYAEIAAAPNLCRGEDSYGILIRASAAAAYRFSLFCNGTVSAERISGKSRQLLQEPLPSGDAPPGAGEVRIGIWARGAEMRLFLNGRYQFGIENQVYKTGAFGVFVNSAGNSPVVVSFSDLVVREIR